MACLFTLQAILGDKNMVKIKPEDKIFSLFIRTRDRWTCQRCGAMFKPSKDIYKRLRIAVGEGDPRGLHTMHCFGRKGMATRFDEDNCCAGCYGCHSYLDGNLIEKQAFFCERLGDDKWDELIKKSKEIMKLTKEDKKYISNYYKMRLEDLIVELNNSVLSI